MIRVRHGFGLARDLVSFAAHSGRWWLPMLMLVLAVTVVVALTLKTVVAPTMYVLF